MPTAPSTVFTPGLQQVCGSNGDPMDVSGVQIVTSASFTRPADVVAYAALDVVSNSTTAATVLTFANAGRTIGNSGLILSARHTKNNTTISGFRLFLWKAAPTAINDNLPFTLLYANRTNEVGFIDFNHVTGGTGSDASTALTTFTGLPYVCAAGSSSLFGILVATAGYTPASAEQHLIELTIAQN